MAVRSMSLRCANCKTNNKKWNTEKEQLQRRIEEGVESQISILRPPALSAVAAANKYYIAELVGGKLSDLIDIPGIDLDRSYSNYAIEIGNLLGVEAARRFLHERLSKRGKILHQSCNR